jgi:hypothetical protein
LSKISQAKKSQISPGFTHMMVMIRKRWHKCNKGGTVWGISAMVWGKSRYWGVNKIGICYIQKDNVMNPIKHCLKKWGSTCSRYPVCMYGLLQWNPLVLLT